ncbi:GTPase-associated system all-helical protein GASH [Clostridium sp. MB40-C1]|uniref:GTPase-associated system all-helical protein GASH n=1 Tax=Clostridium sp. MB40-C1 TaxID=3070996 RepID=UPI0027E03C89|nr:GTPase-associated system all-helical protein GASH [Clostridium sp. MB40-C1]WMJ81435.1 GTPase-associated system all-helical protein GASH [Clostridium sp. MB40-C1]
MEKNIGTWYGQANISCTSDILDKRKNSIKTYIEEGVDWEFIKSIIKLFIKGKDNKQDKFKESFADIFIKDDSAFSYEQDKEIQLLAGIMLNEILKGDNKCNTMIELSCICLKNYYDPPIEGIFNNIEKGFYDSLKQLRENEDNECTKSNFEKSLQAMLKENPSLPQPNINDEVAKQLESLKQNIINIFSNFEKMQKINNLKSEDSEVLWWMIGEWSYDLNKPFKKIDDNFIPILIGKEMADKVNVLPGPFAAKAVINKILSNYEDRQLYIYNYAEKIEKDWLNRFVKEYYIEAIADFMPILKYFNKINEIDEEDNSDDKLEKICPAIIKKTKILNKDIAYSIYLECLLSKAYKEREE